MRRVLTLLFFTFYFSLFTCVAQYRHSVSYLDSVIYYFGKAKTNSKVDSLIFEKGIRLIDSIPTDDNSFNRIEKVADYFMITGKYEQYSLIRLLLYNKLIGTNNSTKAIEYGKEIINKIDSTNNPHLRNLRAGVLGLMRQPYRTSDKLDEGFDYYAAKLKQYLERKDSVEISSCYFVLGGFYNTKGLDELSIYYYKKSLDYINVNDNSYLIRVHISTFNGMQALLNNKSVIGARYIDIGNYSEGLKYLISVFKSSLSQNDTNSAMFPAYNIAYARLMENKYDSIEYYLQFALKSLKTNPDASFEANVLQIKGLYFLAFNKLDSSEQSLQECIRVMDKYNVPPNSKGNKLIPYYYLAQIRIKQGRFKEALEIIKKETPRLINLRKALLLEYKLLAETYTDLRDYKSADTAYQQYISTQELLKADELKNRSMSYETEKKISDAESTITDLETEKKIASISRNYSLGIAALLLIIAVVIFNRFRNTRKQKIIVEKAKQRSDELLLNILPAEVAEELKEKGTADAKHFDEVTVMFTDFKSFTAIAEKLSAKELVAEIDYCFKGFDNITHKYGIEKIKTIGDSYMAAGGLPVPNKTHAKDVVSAALEIVKFMEAHKQQRIKGNKPVFEIRIGINTGPVVAGIVGLKKFAYDIWGDTVNLASRMESSGEPGKVNISGSTYELVKNDFTCTYRGKIQAKNKGEVDMYFVG